MSHRSTFGLLEVAYAVPGNPLRRQTIRFGSQAAYFIRMLPAVADRASQERGRHITSGALRSRRACAHSQRQYLANHESELLTHAFVLTEKEDGSIQLWVVSDENPFAALSETGAMLRASGLGWGVAGRMGREQLARRAGKLLPVARFLAGNHEL